MVQVRTAIIVGSGAAAAGAALALSRREDLEVTILDIGLKLETDRQQVVDSLSSASPDEWKPELITSISRPQTTTKIRGVPEKQVFGSNYPFRNVGQIDGVSVASGATNALISSAYGGFSNVWGSQLMPFTEATFESWPVPAKVMRYHYEAILSSIPFAGEEDDLANYFPLLRSPASLPPMSARSQKVLDAYQEHRPKLNEKGITLGKARLAFNASDCARCGMCMTGCPYGLIYSASQTFDALRHAKKVDHRSGLLVLKVVEQANKAIVIAKEIATERIRRFEADRVYVACGAIGTTRLAANSLELADTDIRMLESQQFVLPLLSMRPTEDPRRRPDFTLNQFNMIVAPSADTVDLSQLHFYTYNEGFVDALPAVFGVSAAEWLQVQLLRRLTVAFGYLPSWRSPQLRIHIGSRSQHLDLPDCHISGEGVPLHRNRMLMAVLRKLAYAGRLLDLYPVIPMLRLSPSGKSYHWGGSFPHADNRSTLFTSDVLGRIGSWERIHLVDASVFPTVPAMTYGLTVMANAHRIATESLELS